MEKTIKKRKDEKPIIPKWMDCTWRRVPCGRVSCPICSRIKAQERRHEENGEDSEDLSVVLEDAVYNIHEALAAIKADAASKGLKITNLEKIKRPPSPIEWPLYVRLKAWRDDIFALADEALDNLEAWPMFESGQDLLWYSNMVLAKTYRQLCNRWQIEQGGDYGEADRDYTSYVLDECLASLKKAFSDLGSGESGPKGKFNLALVYLTGLEKDIRRI